MFGVVAQVQKRVQRIVGNQPNIAAAPAVTPRWSAAGHKLFAPKGRDAVTAMACLNPNLDPIDKHSSCLGPQLSDSTSQIPNLKNKNASPLAANRRGPRIELQTSDNSISKKPLTRGRRF